MTDSTSDKHKNSVEQAAHAPVSFKQMLSYQLEREMALQGLTRVKMAELMQTSRAVVNRLLDPINPSVNLQTIQKAADVLNRSWHIFLQDR